MKPIILLSAFLLMALLAVSAEDRTLAERNSVIRAIHERILQLKPKHEWLSRYNSECLAQSNGANSIFYLAPTKPQLPGTHPPGQPDQLGVGFVPLTRTGGAKYLNDVEDVPACHFAAFGIKISAALLIRSDDDLRKAVYDIIVAECEKSQKKLKESETKP